MSFRNEVLWRAVAGVEAILILWILSLAAFQPKPEPIRLGKGDVLPLMAASAVAATMPDLKESSRAKICIEGFSRRGKYQKIVGWAFVENEQTAGQNVHIQFKKRDGTEMVYTTTSSGRSDVGAYFSNSLYGASGFVALIPLTNWVCLSGCDIRLLIKNTNGTYLSRVWKPGV